MPDMRCVIGQVVEEHKSQSTFQELAANIETILPEVALPPKGSGGLNLIPRASKLPSSLLSIHVVSRSPLLSEK